jgi:hypothetical protein
VRVRERVAILWCMGNPMPESTLINPSSKLTLTPIRGLRVWVLNKQKLVKRKLVVRGM